MNVDEREFQEQLLKRLDDGGWLFEHFQLCHEDGRPVVIGRGSTAYVYAMENALRPDMHYALKAIGYELSERSPGKEREAARLQEILCGGSSYIVRVVGIRELLVLFDRNGNVKEVRHLESSEIEEDDASYYLLLVLTERLEPLLSMNPYRQITLQREELRSPEEVLQLALQIGQALCVMHMGNVLHRDIKLENIYWNEREQVYQLGDLGSARQTENGTAETMIYTDGYGAPEIERTLQERYDYAADIYSLGVTLYLLLNDLQFPGSVGYHCNAAVQYSNGYMFPPPAHGTPELNRIIRRMCAYDPAERYHDVGRLLNDLAGCVHDNETITHEMMELMNAATETFHANAEYAQAAGDHRLTREEWRAERKSDNENYCIATTLEAAALTILFAGACYAMQTTSVYGGPRWAFWLLPVFLVVECMLQHIKDLALAGGILILAYGVYYSVRYGLHAPVVLMAVAAMSGVPAVSGAAAGGTVLWAMCVERGGLGLLDFMQRYDLGWILLLFILVVANKAVTSRWLYDRILIDEWITITGRQMRYIYPATVILGIVLLVLQMKFGVPVPESIRRLHLVRVGIFGAVYTGYWMNRVADLGDDDEEAVDADEDVDTNNEILRHLENLDNIRVDSSMNPDHAADQAGVDAWNTMGEETDE